jgi:hypothetical protein
MDTFETATRRTALTDRIISPETHGSEENDLQLVMDAISDAAGFAAFDESLPPLFSGLPPCDGSLVYRSTFDREPPADVEISASASEYIRSFLIVTFDLASLRRRLVETVSTGVTNSTPVVELLGGLPISVSSRIDAAHENLALAAHFVATAADHLAEAIRCQMRDLLLPLEVSGDSVHWTSAIPVDSVDSWKRLPALLAFSSHIHFVAGRSVTA